MTWIANEAVFFLDQVAENYTKDWEIPQRPSEVFLRLLGLQGNEGSKDNHILPMVASGKVESSGAFACLRHWETPTCSQALQLQIPFSDMLPCGRLELGGRRQP
ncbi:hypothetical protein MUK42_21026 [Musa troglodytarum]|uniref:Uncharacterized protein n=1 Tax=Musa troglodytarum TaxID=320322 RepID=A0A9E7LB54_9LILI|nr:hypothetical protein MUK42_21026 [Musa troglodytarum]